MESFRIANTPENGNISACRVIFVFNTISTSLSVCIRTSLQLNPLSYSSENVLHYLRTICVRLNQTPILTYPSVTILPSCTNTTRNTVSFRFLIIISTCAKSSAKGRTSTARKTTIQTEGRIEMLIVTHHSCLNLCLKLACHQLILQSNKTHTFPTFGNPDP